MKRKKYTKTLVSKMEKDLLRGGPDGGKMTYQQVADKYGVPVGSVGGTISGLRKERRQAKLVKKEGEAVKNSRVDKELNALDEAFNALRDATIDFIEDSAKRVLSENTALKVANKRLAKQNQGLVTYMNTKTLEEKGWKERAKRAFGNYE